MTLTNRSVVIWFKCFWFLAAIISVEEAQKILILQRNWSNRKRISVKRNFVFYAPPQGSPTERANNQTVNNPTEVFHRKSNTLPALTSSTRTKPVVWVLVSTDTPSPKSRNYTFFPPKNILLMRDWHDSNQGFIMFLGGTRVQIIDENENIEIEGKKSYQN